jgi:hypothetical protein
MKKELNFRSFTRKHTDYKKALKENMISLVDLNRTGTHVKMDFLKLE